MRIVMTQPPSANSWDERRQIALSLGLVCEATDCINYDDLPIRLAQEPAADLVLIFVADDTAAALVAIHEASRTGAPVLVAGPAGEDEQVLPLTRARAYLDQAQLRDELNRVLDQLGDTGLVDDDRGRMLGVTAALPGSGVTTVATALAFALAARQPDRVSLAELGAGPPELALALDLQLTHGVADLEDSWERLDATMLHSTLVAHGAGVHVLAQKPELLSAAPLTPAALRQTLLLLKTEFEYTVLDLGHANTVDTQALVLTDSVVLVVRLDVPSLRLTRRYVRNLTEQGLEKAKIRLVANRYGQSKQVGWRQAEEALGLPIIEWIPDDAGALNTALNHGAPLIQTARRANITRCFDRLALKLTSFEQLPVARAAAAKGKRTHLRIGK
jgi:pilus assembly protein CpaE